MATPARAPPFSAQAEEGEDREHHDDETDDIDDVVHGKPPVLVEPHGPFGAQ